jgi:hypothetical protein
VHIKTIRIALDVEATHHRQPRCRVDPVIHQVILKRGLPTVIVVREAPVGNLEWSRS